MNIRALMTAAFGSVVIWQGAELPHVTRSLTNESQGCAMCECHVRITQAGARDDLRREALSEQAAG